MPFALSLGGRGSSPPSYKSKYKTEKESRNALRPNPRSVWIQLA